MPAILSIGETGSGKTTLLNSFANYAHYQTLDEAIENGPRVLADVKFNYTAAGVNGEPVYLIGSANNGNEMVDSVASRTSGFATYTIISDDSEDLIFHDNPGFGSQSSVQGDRVKKPVHALCIVLRPDQTRLHPELRSFLEKEGKAFSKNIIYCFINSRAHNNLPSLVTLRDLLLDLEGTLGVVFPAEKKNIFCFENDCFRYLCYLSQVVNAERSSHHKVLSREWKQNVTEFKRLVNYVRGLDSVLDEFPPIAPDHESLDDESSQEDSESKLDDDLEESDTDDGQKSSNEMNILVLGETGVGKSTFINAVANYLKYNTLHDAMNNGPEVLIRTAFIQLDHDLNRTRIECEPTILDPDDRNDKEELPKVHTIKWGPGENLTTIRLIDTPGCGSNVKEDQTNFSSIIKTIAEYQEIHAILIVLKSNQRPLTFILRYCFFEILEHLHVSAKNNVMFCFTNSRQTLYRLDLEVWSPLKKMLGYVKNTRGITIPLNNNNTFFFDNEDFRFLCAWNNNIRSSKDEVSNYAKSWDHSVKETFRLLQRIKELKPHQVQETLTVNNVRVILFSGALARPMEEMRKNLEANRILIENKRKELSSLEKEKKDLDKLDLYVDKVRIHAKELNYPMLVCAGPNCIEMRKFSNGPDEIERIVYKKRCQERCYLTGVKVGRFPNPKIKEAACFGNGAHPERCDTCGCGWETHLHIRYDLLFTTERVIDPTVIQSRNNNETKQRQAEVFILAERRKLRGLEELSNKLRDYCSEFAAFIHVNSLLPYNDVYWVYVDFFIRKEEMKIANGASSFMRDRLIEHRTEYKETVKHLRAAAQSTSNRSSQKTPEDITAMLQEFRDLLNGVPQ